MKKIKIGLMIFDIILGLLLLYTWEDRQYTETIGRPENSVLEVNTEELPPESKKIALTFDDGPHFRYTEELLDGLKARDVPATFFVTGEHAALHPDIIRRINKEGHLIGNHTYSHIQLTKSNSRLFREELIKTNQILEELIGEEITYVRPPYGSWDKNLEKDLNMIPVLWTVDPQDWRIADAAQIAASVVNQTEENDIILMHDYFDASIDAALQIVDTLQGEGYVFVTVEELLFD